MSTVQEMTIINASAGEKKYVGGTISEVFGADITPDTFEVALSPTGYAPLTGWVAPDVNSQGATVADRTLLMLITSTSPRGTFSCWARVQDTVERPVRCLQTSIVIV